ncbi:MAG: transcription termination/antitermination protein NusA [Candidatus Moraniibacteriota bacterium]|nr:MAG: transcription termination/antitermination protein NusA [Candidatus Moranbacteria bacterium]
MVEEKNPFSDFTGAMTALAEEKGIDVDSVMETVETAIAAAYKKEYGKRGQNIRAELNSVSGDMKFYLVKEVVDETTREFIDPDAETEAEEVQDIIVDDDIEEEKKSRFNPERDITVEDAKKKYGEVELGETVEEELPAYTDFGRVAAQTAKQVIIQRVREAERNAMYAEYKEKEGEIINGTVQRVEGKNVFVDLGKSIGVLFPREQVRGERYNIGQRVKVYVESVELDPKGPGIKLSRVHPELIRRLFELEVPEIFAGSVDLKAVAREAGSRSKIAVYTEEDGVDPIGSCVGQKGTRVNAIIDELGGEKIDIIEWSDDAEEYITAALSPATVLSVEIDDETQKATVVVPDDQLSLAIGKRGQNVRLAVKLTGWDIDVISADESRVPGKDVEINEESEIEDNIQSDDSIEVDDGEKKENVVEKNDEGEEEKHFEEESKKKEEEK